jgi:hypothetical protein
MRYLADKVARDRKVKQQYAELVVDSFLPGFLSAYDPDKIGTWEVVKGVLQQPTQRSIW